MFVQSPDVSRALPELSDTTRLDKQASPEPVTSNTTSTPSPAGMVEPVKLNPITVLLPVDTVKPASPAAPPPAPVTSTPSMLNWKPAMAVSLLYMMFTLPPG